MGSKKIHSYKKIVKCRLCDSTLLKKFIDFGNVPLGNNLFNKKKQSLTAEEYPLGVQQCETCSHFQLTVSVSPNLLYATNYTYLSNIGRSFVSHIKKYTNWIEKQTGLMEGAFVVDIGSNDGTCLQEFKKKGYTVCGVDPAELPAKIANDNDVFTINDFFNIDVVKKIIKRFGKADVITSQNVLAHIDELKLTFKNIFYLLKDDGYLCFEIGYFKNVLESGFFDTIYHEHLDYHHAFPLIKYLNSIGFKIVKINLNKVQGGSLRILAKKNKLKNLISSSAANFLDLEKKSKIYDQKFLKLWEHKVKSNMNFFSEKLLFYHKSGFNILGYGAPTKAVLLLKIAKIPKNIIDFIIEDNSLKVGKFLPYYGTEIRSINDFKIKKKTIITILAWNFQEDIILKIKKLGYKNIKIIIPLPEYKEINI